MSGHVAPKSLYYLVFGALIIGTILTVVVAKFDLGPLNNILMLTIASAKALLVVLFFMHVRWGTRLTWVVAASGFFWLLILFGMTMQDYLTRGWVDGIWRFDMTDLSTDLAALRIPQEDRGGRGRPALAVAVVLALLALGAAGWY